MSDNIFPNKNNENESLLSGYYGNNLSSKFNSFSALNKDNKNIHNSIYSDILPGNDKIIIKNNMKFKGDLNKINPYFYKDNATDVSQCAKECKRVKQCSAFEYDKMKNKCNLYNEIPNDYEEDSNMISGHKTTHKYDFSNLNRKKQDNVIKRIGSQYLQQKFNIKNVNDNKDLNKCIKVVKGKMYFKLWIQFYQGNNIWDGSRAMKKFYLTYRGKRVSAPVYSNGYNYKRNGYRWWWWTFPVTSEKIDGLEVDMGNDGIRIRRLSFYVMLGNIQQSLFTINRAVWIKRRRYNFRFPKTVDMNDLSFIARPSTIFKGTEKNITKYYDKTKTDELDNIYMKDNFSIKVNYKVSNNQRFWRNIFHYGNNNGERAPAMWIFPGNPWRVHFRLRTINLNNRYVNTNDGYDFNIPGQFRKYNMPLMINMDFIAYQNHHNSYHDGFIMNVTVNGVWAGSHIFNARTPVKLTNRLFQIKDKWYRKYGYEVMDVTFDSVPLLKLTTGYGRGRKENSYWFNKTLKNLKPPYYLIRVGYSGYRGDYRYIVYKRLTDSSNVDMYDLMHKNWFNEVNGIKNKHKVDFNLFSTLDDAINDRNPWKFCNFNDPGVGFPRDCGRDTPIGGQWQSKTRGGKITWEFYLYKAQESSINTNLSGMYQKISGFDADAKCAYHNTDNPIRVFKRNQKLLTDEKPSDFGVNNDLINADLTNFMTDIENRLSIKTKMNNTKQNRSDVSRYNEDVEQIKEDNVEPDKNALDYDILDDAIGDNIENFDNKSWVNINPFYKILIVIIILLILFYFLFKD